MGGEHQSCGGNCGGVRYISSGGDMRQIIQSARNTILSLLFDPHSPRRLTVLFNVQSYLLRCRGLCLPHTENRTDIARNGTGYMSVFGASQAYGKGLGRYQRITQINAKRPSVRL